LKIQAPLTILSASMRTKADIISQLTDPGVIAVVRAKKVEQVLPLTAALIAGGVIAIEITMTTPDAINCIRMANEKFGEKALIGVGTVLDNVTCRAAIDAGAQFVVSPICRPELVQITRQAQRPVMLGAYTPTEAQAVHEAGADFVKLFPADSLGASYIRALRAPLPHLQVVPTGGVSTNNIADFFKAGCVAVGVGSTLISQQILEQNDWPQLTKLAAEFVDAAKAGRRL
jgi:2-dehydro-3-deoxyphosphogluconate aldolase/(4S)-4-hydroxy-2-oxoglutarate aldolase